MLCLHDISILLKRCTDEGWGTCLSVPVRFHDENLRLYRWQHTSSQLGFLIAVSQRKEPMGKEDLRDHIQFFRHWKGKNLGLLLILESGMTPDANQSLPYYGHLRTAVLDFSTEQLHFGSDSSKFQFLVCALASVLGISSGGRIGAEIRAIDYNRTGPKNWNRIQLQIYENEDRLDWHPLWLASVFPELELGLNSCLHHQNTVISLFPEALPLCSFPLRRLMQKHPEKTHIVLYRHSLTPVAKDFIEGENIECHYVENTVIESKALRGR